MALQQYRVVYRRVGKKAEQKRVFGQWPKAWEFATRLDQPHLLRPRARRNFPPIDTCYIQARPVGRWKTVETLR